MSKSPLHKYKEKRDFTKTTEPKGKTAPTKKTLGKKTAAIFVVQKHAASHLHYDLRLEINGVLKSWAVPKGISKELNVKHLAVQTEDHPMEYAKFAGTIPEGNYGAGKVEIWDSGTYESLSATKTLAVSLKSGAMKIRLHGKKLKGSYALVRMGDKIGTKSNWLIFRITRGDPKYAGA